MELAVISRRFVRQTKDFLINFRSKGYENKNTASSTPNIGHF